ncbi:chorismate synthase [Cordyceps javanica]|uniref:chorismate synthase n=1 Tax=Cordyceps javanica TaxID=43265 RepID=A0A545UMV3_9HYPO|nr:chorismate synthase [Cordyceps javanica]
MRVWAHMQQPSHLLGILLTVPNEDQRPHDYDSKTIDLYRRPSHTDRTYLEKYGIKASSGGGRSSPSARETIARVAAGAVAEKWLREAYGIEIAAFVSSVGNIKLFEDKACFLELIDTLTREKVDEFLPVRCPDTTAVKRMENKIAELRDQHDSTSGTVTCIIRGCLSGLGEPCFDKLEALLAHAIISIPATKGFKIGSGFRGAEMRGSRHNDPFVCLPPPLTMRRRALALESPLPVCRPRRTILAVSRAASPTAWPFRVAFEPPATISQYQTAARYDASGEGVLAAKGRHDPNGAPRAVRIVEAMADLTIADALMAQHARQMGVKVAAAGR